jgi:hypothetical protein
MNISSQSQTTYKNTVVSLTSPAREILVPEKEGMVNNVMPGENKDTLPECLNNLFYRTKIDSSRNNLVRSLNPDRLMKKIGRRILVNPCLMKWT